MKKIVMVVGAADGRPTPHDGRYVVAWNPHTTAGTLELTSTANRAEARRFDIGEAMGEWRTISRVQPLRPWDKKPNRPLTGVTIQILGENEDEFGLPPAPVAIDSLAIGHITGKKGDK